MSNKAFLIFTKQAWKLRTFYIFVIILFMIRVITQYKRISLTPEGHLTEAYYMIFLVAVFFLMFYSIRCPKCKKCVAWYIFKTTSFRKTFHEISYFKKCPICEYSEDEHIQRLKEVSNG